jgi:uncharacterized repeat protein (TIGR01451 family)
MRPSDFRSRLGVLHSVSVRRTLVAMLAVAGLFFATRKPQGASAAGANSGANPMMHAGSMISARYSGTPRAQQALQQGNVKPLSMATADFDRDGVADLVVGYAASGGGIVSVHRGNLDAFAPQSQASWQAIAQSQFPSPFLPQAQAVEVPVAPNFLAAGDFTGDGAADILVAARGGNMLYLLAGDGHGNFAKPQSIALPGAVTAMAGGHVGDSQAATLDLAVGVATPQASQLLIYRAQAGALTLMASYPLASPATAFAFGNLEGDSAPDLAVVSGGQVFVLHGGEVPSGPVTSALQGAPGQLVALPIPGTVSGIALGTFINDRNGWTQMALLSPDGSVAIAAPSDLDTRPYAPGEASTLRTKAMTDARARRDALQQGLPDPVVPRAPTGSLGWRVVEYLPATGAVTSATAQTPIVQTHISAGTGHDIAVMDPSARQIHVLSHPSPNAAGIAAGAVQAPAHTALSVNAAGSLVAVLPMRVNVDGRPGMVVLSDGQVTPTVMMPLPDPTYTVNRFDDPAASVALAATYCIGIANDCSLRQAVIKANTIAGCDTIMVPAGTITLTIPASGTVNGPHDSTAGRLDIQDCVSIVGATSGGLPASIVQAGTNNTNGVDKVFSVNPDFNKAFVTSFSNLEVRFGRNAYPFYSDGFAGDGFGAGIDWEADDTGTLSVTNCNIHDNTSTDGGGAGLFLTNSVSEVGGATVSGSTIANNSAHSTVSGSASEGGGIFSGGTGTNGAGVTPVAISNTTLSGNSATNAGTAASIGGGLSANTGGNGNPYAITFSNSVISGNSASLDGGGVYVTAPISIDLSTIRNNTAGRFGGGVYTHACGSGVGCAAGSPNGTTITHSTITGNNATAADGGGGVFQDGGGAAATLHFNRIFGNKIGGSTGVAGTGVVSNQGASGGNPASIANATDNWWGCNSDPASGTGCDKITATNGGTETHSPWIVLSLAASPTTLQPQPPGATTSALTASFLQDSNGTAIAASNLNVLLNLPITFNAPHGTISGAQTTIQSAPPAAAGTATANVSPDSSCVTLVASATVDSGTPTANITVVCPNLTAPKTDSVSGSVPLAPGSWTWTITVQNSNAANSAPALFTNGALILSDQLPSSTNISYGSATPGNFSGITNSANVSCGISGNLMTCGASGADVTVGIGGSFQVSFTATATVAGSYINPTGGACAVDPSNVVIESLEGDNSCFDIVKVVAPPTISKAFGATGIPVGGTTTLTFTLTNPAANTVNENGVAFSDTLTGGLQVAGTPNLSNGCGGTFSGATSGSTSLSLSGGAISFGSSCTISLNVTGTTAGVVTNTTGAISSTNGGTGVASNTATLKVANPSTISKSFAVSSIPLNASTTVTFTITNPNPTGVDLSGIAFNDPLPAGLSVAGSPNVVDNCGGTVTASGSTISLSNGSLTAATHSCTISVNVTGTAAGSLNNTTGAITATESGAAGAGSNTATLLVVAPPSISKAFNPSTVPLGNDSTVTFIITNPNSGSGLSGVGFTDNLPSGLQVSSSPNVQNSCNGTVTAAANTGIISLSGGTISASGSCAISVNVTPGSATTYSNQTSTVSSTEGGSGAASNSATLIVQTPACFLPPSGMVSWWPGEGNANDITGGNNGTPTNTTFTTGEVGQAFSFDGSTSYFSVADAASLDVSASTGLTFDMWVNPSQFGGSTSGYRLILGKRLASGWASYFAYLDPNGKLGLGFQNQALNEFPAWTTTQPLALNDWSHIAFVFQAQNFNSTDLTIYVNGAAVATTFAANNYASNFALAYSTDPLRVGGDPDNLVGGYFAGQLDEIEFFNRVLTASDVSNIYLAGSAGKCKSNATISKAFSPTSIAAGATSTMSFTINNSNPEVNLTGVSFTDNFPSGLSVAIPVNTSDTCGGGVTVGTSTFSLNGGHVPHGGSCSVSIDVTSSTAGSYNNTTGAISTNEAGTGNTSNTVTLTVIAPPTISKQFGAANIPVNGTTTMTFTLTNPAANTVAENGVAFTDTLTGGLQVAGTPNLSNSCGGTFNGATSGSTSLSLTGGTVSASNGSCTISLNVTGTTGGVVSNTTSAVSSTNGGTGATSNTATLSVGNPPTITKGFSPSTIKVGGTSMLSFTINNPNASQSLSGVTFSDSLPSGVQVASTPATSNTCNGTLSASAGSGTVGLSAGTVAAGGSCAISVNVTGTTAGVKNNTTGTLSSTETGPGTTSNTATLTVVSPPTIAKAFASASIPLGTSVNVTFTITNPNTTTSLSGLAFSDPLPSGLSVSTTPNVSNTCNGTVTAAANSTSISLAGGTLTSNGSGTAQCAITVSVTGTTAGLKSNTTGAVSATESGTGVASNTATVTVVAPPTISKGFSPGTIAVNGTSTLSFTISNPNSGTGLTGVAFSDTLPAGVQVASTPNAVGNCGGGTFSPAGGSGTVALTGGTIAASGSCTTSVDVTATTGGVKSNTTGAVSSTEGGTGTTSNTATLTVGSAATISKSFSPGSIAVGRISTLSFTINNPNASLALTGVSFSDSLPSGVQVASAPNASNTCGGTFTAAANATSVSLGSGTVAAGASCAISVNVTGTTAGVKNNTTGVLSSNEGGPGTTSNTATLTVVAPPTIAKAFASASIPLGTSVNVTLTITNPNTTTSLSGLAFSDPLPSGLSVSTTPNVSNTCNGTVTAAANSTSISLAGGTLTFNGTGTAQCAITVSVTGTTTGLKSNTTGAISSTEGGTGTGSNTATVTVVAPPTISKGFSPGTIAVNGTSTLSFTISNPNSGTGLTGVAFSDSLPAGVQVAATPNAVDNCGGTFSAAASSTSVSLSGGTVSAGGSCTLSVSVTGTTGGVKNNTTGAVSSTEGGTGTTSNTATLTVGSAATITKGFSPSSIAVGGISTLSFTINNPNASIALTGVSFSDSLPSGVQVASVPNASNTCGGTFTAAANATSVSLGSGTVAAGGSCNLSVKVTGTSAGVKNNTTGALSSNEGGTGSTSNTATLTVVAPPTISKGFGASTVALHGSVVLSFAIANPNTVSLSGVAFSDALPAGLQVAATPGATNTCGGTFTASPNATSVNLAGGGLTASGSCAITVNVTGTSAGVKSNTTGAISSTESGAGATSNTATVTVVAPPTISKGFSPANIAVNGTSTLSFTIANPNSTVGLTGLAFNDTFPAGAQVASTPNAVDNCGGTFSAVAASGTVSLTAGTVGAGTSCTISVAVTGTTAGVKSNTTGAVTSTEGGTGTTSNTANLTVGTPATITKSFSPSTIAVGGTSTLGFTLNNPGTQALSGLSFTDAFPSGIQVSSSPSASNNCGGTFTAAANATSIGLSGGSLAAGHSCTLSVKVKGTSAGVLNNTTGPLGSTQAGIGPTSNTATLTVIGMPVIVKAFGAPSIPLNGITSVTFNITNPNPTVSTGVSFSDSLPSGLEVANLPGASNTCNGTLTAAANSGSITLKGGSIAANGSCVISVNVTGTTIGTKNNTTEALTCDDGTGNTSNTATLIVVAPPTISKGFSPDNVAVHGNSTLSFTIKNPNSGTQLTGVGFSDTFPTGVVVASTPGAVGNCGGGTFAPTANSGVVSLSGGTIAAGGSCTISVSVTGTTAGTKNNTTGAVGSTQGGTGKTSNTATLTVGSVGPIDFVQAKSATPQSPSQLVSVTYPAQQTAGNLNIVVVGWNDTTATVMSVTDSKLDAYALAIGPTTGTGLRQSIYYAKSIAGGSNTVTVKFSQAATFVDVRVLEYSGLNTTNPLDVMAGASGHGTSASSGSATTTSANELIFGAGMTSGVFSGAGSGFTTRIITSPDGDIAEDKTVTSTGSNSATASGDNSNWVMQMATFRQ